MSEEIFETRQDKIDFLNENVPDLLITDETELPYIDAMKQLFHIAQDKRFPDFIRNSMSVIFAHIEDGNFDAQMSLAQKDAIIASLESRLGEAEEDYEDYEEEWKSA